MSNVTVLLVEAGGYFNWLSMIPLAAPLMQGSANDWSFKTEPQLFSSKGLENHRQSYPLGRGLGGSGQLNYLVHSFGKPEDFQNWPNGWTHDDLLPYFENVASTMNVESIPTDGELIQAFLHAGKSVPTEDASFHPASSTLRRGARLSSYHAYLQYAWHRNNLHVLTETRATKIIFYNATTDGIEVTYKDDTQGVILAKKEVILCAGSVNTPQLLMISGVGSSEELERLGIPIVSNRSNVGKNLFDHLNVPLYVNLEAPISATLRKIQSISEVYKYFVSGTGLLATNGIIGLASLNGSGIIFFSGASADEKLLKNIANFKTETFRAMFPSHNNTSHEGFLYLTSCWQPKSRGTISLRSASIFDPPVIDPAYLENDDDVECIQKAIKLALQTLDTKLFREFGARIHVPDLDDCRHWKQDYLDDDYSECVMRTAGLTSHHPCGSCQMGTNDDAVVDEYLRVKGVNGLRIADASILPSPISGTPNSVIIAIANRAVDVILGHSTARFNSFLKTKSQPNV
ncbi:neither inactivation nor afterpotential protein G isoform X2 [Orussus abietinus]|nr:neither inactivation nor afterpotential protein G isoform X2 [Orussus abietinus]